MYSVEEELIYNEKTDRMEVVSQTEMIDSYDVSDATAVLEQALPDGGFAKIDMHIIDETTISGTRTKSFDPGKRPVKWEPYDEYNPSDGITFHVGSYIEEDEKWADYTTKKTTKMTYSTRAGSDPHEDVETKTKKTNPTPTSSITIREVPKDRLKGTLVRQEKHGTITYDVTITYDYEYS
jgi:hypothetical protein